MGKGSGVKGRVGGEEGGGKDEKGMMGGGRERGKREGLRKVCN